jgi:hypothetical protein
MKSGRPQKVLEERFIEAGHAPATDTAGTEPLSVDTRAEASGEVVTPSGLLADGLTRSAPSPGMASPDTVIHSCHKVPCPNCGAPADRVRRRTRDRVVSLIVPVRRYRCSMKGWGCEWEGILRKRYWHL